MVHFSYSFVPRLVFISPVGRINEPMGGGGGGGGGAGNRARSLLFTSLQDRTVIVMCNLKPVK